MPLYSGSSRKFERLSKLLLWIIAIILALFLIFLGNKILSDIDNWYKDPEYSQFENHAALSKIEALSDSLDKKGEIIDEKKDILYRSLEIAERKYDSEKNSFEDWVETRKTIGSATQDREVIARVKKLDDYREIKESWQSKLDTLESSKDLINREREKLSEKRFQINIEDDKKYDLAYKKYSLKVFFLRLIFVAPILAIAIFIFIRFRKSKFWPFVWGYILFSLYAFFVGLIPYWPDFGGYIRYVVGIVLTILLGYYLIKKLTQYIEKKKAELQQSTKERVKKIEQLAAIKAFNSHCCPSCERDFLMIKIHPKTKTLKDIVVERDAPSYCPHCGLNLFGKCEKCGQRNFIHFPFCSSCGVSIKD